MVKSSVVLHYVRQYSGWNCTFYIGRVMNFSSPHLMSRVIDRIGLNDELRRVCLIFNLNLWMQSSLPVSLHAMASFANLLTLKNWGYWNFAKTQNLRRRSAELQTSGKNGVIQAFWFYKEIEFLICWFNWFLDKCLSETFPHWHTLRLIELLL